MQYGNIQPEFLANRFVVSGRFISVLILPILNLSLVLRAKGLFQLALS